jgi:hypothetical protein
LSYAHVRLNFRDSDVSPSLARRDTYTDLGAIVTDNQSDTLGYKTFLNGALVSNIVIDTTEVATDTIDYVARDTWGNTSTSTRTVIIEANPSIVPTNEASTTPASSQSVR